MPLPQLRRIRWAVRATLTLGVAASVAANILHANPNPISQVIAAWPPLALLLTVELISRVPVHRRSLAAVRVVATSTIASIAAWVSYWHMAGVAARYGESGASPYLLPLSVDGLIIVASVSLVELAGRIRETESTAAESAPLPVPADLGTDGATVVARPAPATATQQPTIAAATKAGLAKGPRRPAKSAATKQTTGTSSAGKATPRTRRPVAETAALVARLEADQPDLTPDDIAARLGISTQYLRRIKREVPVLASSSS
jgi:hypothetical protein